MRIGNISEQSVPLYSRGYEDSCAVSCLSVEKAERGGRTVKVVNQPLVKLQCNAPISPVYGGR